jgi:transcription antitermination factor NusG
MESNWYVICTKKKKEKKVAAVLNKKGIENYCPFTTIETKNVSRSAKEYGPLFSSYIFVKMQQSDLQTLKTLPYVINPLFWKKEPAIINADEINAIKMMCENYSTIKLEKIAVELNENISVVERNITGYSNRAVMVEHKGISISLPTLGYSISADRDKERKTTEKIKQPENNSLASRLNPLLFFGIHL